MPATTTENTSNAAHSGACSLLTSFPTFRISVAAKISVNAPKPNPNGPANSVSM